MGFLLSNRIDDSSRRSRGHGALWEVHSILAPTQNIQGPKRGSVSSDLANPASRERWPRCHRGPSESSSGAGGWTDCSHRGDLPKPAPFILGALLSPESGYPAP